MPYTWDPTEPDDEDAGTAFATQLRQDKDNIKDALAEEHDFPTTGKHKAMGVISGNLAMHTGITFRTPMHTSNVKRNTVTVSLYDHFNAGGSGSVQGSAYDFLQSLIQPDTNYIVLASVENITGNYAKQAGSNVSLPTDSYVWYGGDAESPTDGSVKGHAGIINWDALNSTTDVNDAGMEDGNLVFEGVQLKAQSDVSEAHLLADFGTPVKLYQFMAYNAGSANGRIKRFFLQYSDNDEGTYPLNTEADWTTITSNENLVALNSNTSVFNAATGEFHVLNADDWIAVQFYPSSGSHRYWRMKVTRGYHNGAWRQRITQALWKVQITNYVPETIHITNKTTTSFDVTLDPTFIGLPTPGSIPNDGADREGDVDEPGIRLRWMIVRSGAT